MPRRQRLDDPVLAAVGVLVLVDQYVIELSGLVLQNIPVLGEQFFGTQQQIVKVHSAAVLERPLIAAVGHCRQVLFVGLCQTDCVGRQDGVGFPAADQVDQVAGPQRFVGNADFAQHAAGDALLVAPVANGELFGIAQAADVPPQDLDAVRMKRRDKRPLFESLADQAADSLLHFGGSFVRKGHRQDAAGTDAVLDQVGDPKCDHARLAAAGACQDKQGAGQGVHRFFLSRVQVVCHASDRSLAWRLSKRGDLPVWRFIGRPFCVASHCQISFYNVIRGAFPRRRCFPALVRCIHSGLHPKDRLCHF